MRMGHGCGEWFTCNTPISRVIQSFFAQIEMLIRFFGGYSHFPPQLYASSNLNPHRIAFVFAFARATCLTRTRARGRDVCYKEKEKEFLREIVRVEKERKWGQIVIKCTKSTLKTNKLWLTIFLNLHYLLLCLTSPARLAHANSASVLRTPFLHFRRKRSEIRLGNFTHILVLRRHTDRIGQILTLKMKMLELSNDTFLRVFNFLSYFKLNVNNHDRIHWLFPIKMG